MSDARVKELASFVSDEDWDRLIQFTSQRILQRLTSVGAFSEADPAQIQRAHELVGTTLVDFINVSLTCIAEGEAKT